MHLSAAQIACIGISGQVYCSRPHQKGIQGKLAVNSVSSVKRERQDARFFFLQPKFEVQSQYFLFRQLARAIQRPGQHFSKRECNFYGGKLLFGRERSFVCPHQNYLKIPATHQFRADLLHPAMNMRSSTETFVPFVMIATAALPLSVIF